MPLSAEVVTRIESVVGDPNMPVPSLPLTSVDDQRTVLTLTEDGSAKLTCLREFTIMDKAREQRYSMDEDCECVGTWMRPGFEGEGDSADRQTMLVIFQSCESQAPER